MEALLLRPVVGESEPIDTWEALVRPVAGRASGTNYTFSMRA
jgi:hypothetical protein